MLDPKPYFFDGLKALQQNQLEAALEYFSMAHTLVPQQAGINYAMADTYLRMGDLTSAAYHAKEAVKSDAENKWYWTKLAQIYRSSAQFNDALEALDRAMEIDPSDQGLFQTKIALLQSLNRSDEALAELDKLIEQTGLSKALLLIKLSIVEETGDLDEIIRTLEDLIKFEPNDRDLKRALSQTMMANEQYEEAISLFKEALEKKPEDIGTQLLLIEALYKNEQFNEASMTFEHLWESQLEDNSARIRITQFFILLDEEMQLDEIQQNLATTIDWLIKNAEENPQSLAIAIDHYLKSENVAQAIPLLKSLLGIRPENDLVWRQYLQILYTENRFDEVIIEGKKADENVPDDPYITFFVGSSLQLEGQSDEALEWLSRATSIPSERSFRSIIYGSLGDVYAAKDAWSKAYDAYEKALEYNPDNDNVLNNYAYYLSESDGDLSKAAEMAARANEIRTDVSSYLDTLGWIFHLQNEHEKAREWIMKAIETGDASATVKEHLGDVFQALDKIDEAKKWWKEALEMDPKRTYLEERIQ